MKQMTRTRIDERSMKVSVVLRQNEDSGLLARLAGQSNWSRGSVGAHEGGLIGAPGLGRTRPRDGSGQHVSGPASSPQARHVRAGLPERTPSNWVQNGNGWPARKGRPSPEK